MLEGKVLEFDPPRRLVTTFASKTGKASSSEPCEVETAKDRPSRVTWEIERRGDTCKLTLIHDDFYGETATYKSVGPGWSPVLSGLKTLLETGKPLVVAPPAA